MSDRVSRSILSEELRVGEGRVGKSCVVVFGSVEVFSVGRMSLLVILGTLHVEVVNPP